MRLPTRSGHPWASTVRFSARSGPFWSFSAIWAVPWAYQGPSPGNLAIFPEKRPYLGLGGPNRDSEGTSLGYHPPGLVVSTHSGGPKVRLAPRTGRRGAFRAHFGPLRAKTARNEKTAVSGAGRPESGFRGHFSGVPPPGFGGLHTLWRPQSASSTPYRPPGRV